MPTFDIPTGPSITERGSSYLMSEAKVCCSKCPTTLPPYGSITYDCEKGRMPLEWTNENNFLTWLTAEEHKKTIKLIERHVFKCSWEFQAASQIVKRPTNGTRKFLQSRLAANVA
ncbi:hypothetical protein EDB92DRAFT_1819808 [Lactarius akahatsu]|uniref:Uncharacterized protein n=1 Tax=Lactarius akahatsu TaxID=416441 RepID=A0AAD4LD95_9AGAM|nr:hypothetical protein EDB92DRAFT_1819808 [Lactarius akahatsu]